MVTARNWLDVYPYSNWGGAELPVFQEGQTFMPSELTLRQVSWFCWFGWFSWLVGSLEVYPQSHWGGAELPVIWEVWIFMPFELTLRQVS